ncbi:MAG TPA: hypothetical protein VF167_14180 [Longimicrobiaceae bacterium]
MSAERSRATPSPDDVRLADGLAGVIDRALERHPPGETFVYGIHQHLSPGALERLRQHYLEVGWREVVLREGATGTHLLILTP